MQNSNTLTSTNNDRHNAALALAEANADKIKVYDNSPSQAAIKAYGRAKVRVNGEWVDKS